MSEPIGISILIPVFNHDVRELVKSLIKQGQTLNMAFEIICYDDFSNELIKSLNRGIKDYPNTTYLELDKNIGRSQIRNKLSANAKYSNLLFLDCDSDILDNFFLKRYIEYISEDVVIGGRKYLKDIEGHEYTLHWKIGKEKEEKEATVRSKNPYKSFMSNNFLIKKNIYLNIKMDESLIGYGHEDTKFGYELKKKKIEILHIHNPIIHSKLDSNEVFLLKTKEGIRNFYKIIKEGYSHDTKLYRSFSLVKKLKLYWLYNFFYGIIEKKIEKNLLSNKPSLFYFDLFKLNLLLKQDKHLAG